MVHITRSKLLNIEFALQLICEHFLFSFKSRICVFAVLFSFLSELMTRPLFILHIFLYLRQYCKFSTLQKKTPIILYSKVYNHHYVIIKHQIYTQLCSETTTLCNKFNIDSCVVQIDVASYCKRLFSEVLSEGLIIDTLSVHITYKQHRRGLKVKV